MEDFLPSRRKFASASGISVLLLCFLAFSVLGLYVQSASLGVTAEDAFSFYARATGVDESSYSEVDGGNVVFFLSEEDDGESWLAYEKKGLFYSRSYGLSDYYYYSALSSEGEARGVAAVVAEVKTDKGYYYFVDAFNETSGAKETAKDVVFNGKKVSLSKGTFLVSDEKLSSFSFGDERVLVQL